MKKLLVLIFCLGVIIPNTKAQDSWVMESIEYFMQKDSVTGKGYIEVVFRVVPEGMYTTDNQLQHSRIYKENFSAHLFMHKTKQGTKPMRFTENKKHNPEKVEQFKGLPLEIEVYGPEGFVPPPEKG